MSALRELLASFGFEVDTSALEAADGATSSITEGLKDLGKGVIAAFAVEKVFEFGKELLETADAVAKQSEALGISTEELQGWEHAAQLSGSSAEEFVSAFTKFTRNVNEASDAAGGPAAKAFKALGVSIKDSSGQLGAPIDLLDGVVAGLQNIQDPAKRTALVMDLFGKSGAKLLPLLSEGPEGIKKLRAEVAELGGVFDEAFLQNAQEVNDNVDRLKLGMRGLAIQVIGPLLPELVHLSQFLISGAKSFIAITKQTKVANALLLGVALKTLPMLAGGLGTLASFALEVVAPFLILEDALTFLSGGDSLIGDGLEKAFGSGTGDMVRKWCENAGADIKGTFVGALDLLRLAFADTDEASSKLWQKFELETRGVETAIDSIVDKIKLIVDALTDLETLQQGANDFLDVVTSPFDTEADKAQKVKRREDRAAAKADAALKASGALPEARDVPEHRAAANAYENIANGAGAFGPGVYAPSTATAPAPPTSDYASLFRPTAATAPAGYGSAPGQVTNNVAPVINNNTNITVEGGEDVGNRVGKAINKNAAAGSMRGIKAGLVPTPG
jgi:hypothetical protein